MTACFPTCRNIQILSIITGAAAIIACFYFFSHELLLVRIIYSVICAGLCIAIGQLAATRYAANAHRKLLNTLYQSTDADGFLQQYAPLPVNCKPDSAEHMMTSNYLAAGHMAKGEFHKAIALLQPLAPQTLKFHKMSLVALTHCNLCQCHLWTGNTDKAQEELDILEALRDDLTTRMPAVSQNLGYNIKLYREHLQLLLEKEPDLEYLREEVSLSANPLHNKNMQLLLAKSLLHIGNQNDAVQLLQELASPAQPLYAHVEARRILAQIP